MPPSQLGTIQASSNRIKADVYEQFQSCSVMAGFLLQEIIKCEARCWRLVFSLKIIGARLFSRELGVRPVRAVFIKFTLLQVGIAKGSSEFSRARKACLVLSPLPGHSSPSSLQIPSSVIERQQTSG